MKVRVCLSNCILVCDFYPPFFVLWSGISRVIAENHVKIEQKYIMEERSQRQRFSCHSFCF